MGIPATYCSAAARAQAIQAAELAKRCAEKNKLQMRLDEVADSSNSAISATRAEAVELQRELAECNHALQTATQRLTEMQARLCTAEGTARETAVQLGSALERCSQLEGKVAEAEKKEIDLQALLAEAHESADQHSSSEQVHLEQSVAQAQQIISLNAALQEAAGKLAVAGRCREEAEAQLREAAAQRKALDAELDAAAGELMRKGYEHEEKVTALLQQLHGARDRLAAAEAELAAAQDENMQLSGDNAPLEGPQCGVDDPKSDEKFALLGPLMTQHLQLQQ